MMKIMIHPTYGHARVSKAADGTSDSSKSRPAWSELSARVRPNDTMVNA